MKKKPAGRNDTHTFDYSRVLDKLYIGSDFCSGSLCKFHGDQFKKLGVCVEINLAIEKKETPPEDIDIYAWLPVVDGRAPTMDQFLLGTSIINQAIIIGNTVYVHCRNGHGRSPTMVAAYLIRYKNHTVNDAVKFITDKGKETHIEDEQKKALVEFFKLCQK